MAGAASKVDNSTGRSLHFLFQQGFRGGSEQVRQKAQPLDGKVCVAEEVRIAG